jgi:hypothetical protein
MYKALLPLYRQEEMDKEIRDEWIMDSRGNSCMKYSLFVKALFRVVHWWAVDIDLEQYTDLLTKIYERITCKYHVEIDKRTQILPKIEVGFPMDEKKFKD